MGYRPPMATTSPRLSLVPDTIDASTYGSSITALMQIDGRSQTEVAPLLGFDQPTLSKILKGKRKLGYAEAVRIAGILDVPVAVFELGGDEIRRRAKQGLLLEAPHPDGGTDLPDKSSPWMDNVVDFGARQAKLAPLVALGAAA